MREAVRCPRDRAEMRVERSGGFIRRFTIDLCPKCGGTWFDRGEIGKITRDRDLERLIVDYAGGRSEVACPRCAVPMARRPVSEVTLDACLKCRGVWVDAGELEAAARTLGNLAADAMFAAERGRSASPAAGTSSWAGRGSALALAVIRDQHLRTRLEASRWRLRDTAADRPGRR